jgi:quinol monooxygenase YgiN
MSVFAIVNIEAVQGKVKLALEVIKKSQSLCLALDECSGFEVLQSQEDEHRFIFIEQWVSVQWHKDFLEKLMSDEAFIESLQVFTSGPSIEYFDNVMAPTA